MLQLPKKASALIKTHQAGLFAPEHTTSGAEHVLWADKTKLVKFGAWCCMFGQHQAPYQHKLLKHKQHSGGGVRIWLVLQPQDVMTLQWSIRPTGQWSKIQQLIKVLQWSSQNPYHNLIEILSINKYPQSSSTVLRLERQIKSDRKHWFQIIGAKDGPTNDWLMWCN